MSKSNSNRGLRKEFEVGQVVGLDLDRGNGSVVTVVSQTPKKLFTTVTSNGKNVWDVMTNRISEIEKSIK